MASLLYPNINTPAVAPNDPLAPAPVALDGSTPPATAPIPYQPIQTPPGGLLASAVGTTMAPLPPTDPYAMEDDSVVGQLNQITDSGSSYIKQAEAAGQRTAQRRGLLNSSVAAGAARGAAINAAAPLAMQEAQQRAGRNQIRVDAGFQKERLGLSIASNEKMQGIDVASREKMQADALAAESERLGRTLTAQEQAQLRDITNSQFLQNRDLESRQTLQTQMIQAESERLGRQLTAQEVAQTREMANQQFMQGRDISSREGMLSTELANRLTIAREDAASQLERLGLTNAAENMRANLNAATQIQLQTLQNLNAQQQSSLQYYASLAGNYLQAATSVWNNTEMPAAARQTAIDQFAAVLNSGINMPAALYGTNMTWGQNAGTPAMPPVTVPTTGNNARTTPGWQNGGTGGITGLVFNNPMTNNLVSNT